MGKSSRSWTRGGTRSWRRSEAAGADLGRVAYAVHRARRWVPGYGREAPISTGDVRRLAVAVGLVAHRAAGEMDAPAVLLPPLRGRYQLVMAQWVNPLVARHVTLHEIGHVLMGDINEATILTWHGPMPEAEDCADLFSLVALLDDVECAQGQEFVETRIREVVPLDNYGWQTYRVPRLAGQIERLKRLAGEMGED